MVSFEEWEKQPHPFTAEDHICQHKGEQYHKHKKYQGKEVLPYHENQDNYNRRMRREAFEAGAKSVESKT